MQDLVEPEKFAEANEEENENVVDRKVKQSESSAIMVMQRKR